MTKTRVAIIFGGASAEHDVSIMSAAAIIKSIDQQRYTVALIGLDKKNSPYRVDHLESVDSADVFNGAEAISKVALTDFLLTQVDVAFPIIHGPGGEDGQLQGFLKFLGVPFVGADVTASAVCMDKRLAKEILKAHNFSQAPFVSFTKQEFESSFEGVVAAVEAQLKYPVFVKPSNLGSSLGIHKVMSAKALQVALEDAFRFDGRILIEQGIDARELECGIIGNENPKAMAVGEIVASHEFYDYEAKYSDACPSTLTVPANVPQAVIEEIQRESLRAYRLLGVEGMARVDFLVDKHTMKVYLSELNTLPGFTKFSMYPTLCGAAGISYPELISTLIDLAFGRVTYA